jgi:hypothetical protein
MLRRFFHRWEQSIFDDHAGDRRQQDFGWGLENLADLDAGLADRAPASALADFAERMCATSDDFYRVGPISHGDFAIAGDHMGVGEHVAVLADDEAGAQALARTGPRAALRRIGHEAAEELEQRVFGLRLRPLWCLLPGLAAVIARAPGGVALGDDVHHGRALLLHQRGEIGQVGGSASGGRLFVVLRRQRGGKGEQDY